jgi:eukaryotic-like serine/threonine-protein kinase
VTQLAGLVGSPAYMSPEQVRELVCTHQSDMFSLGIVLYQLMTGRNPFEGENDFTTLYRISTEMPAPPSTLRAELPPEIDDAIMRALTKDPAGRFGEWRDFADALLDVSQGLPARRAEDREGERFARMRALAFFEGFHDAALWETLRLGTLHSFARGEVLMREGTTGESFHIILEGTVAVRRNDFTLTVLSPGVTLGEMAYLRQRGASEALQTRFDRAFIKLLVGRLIATNAQVSNWDLLDGQTK